MVWLVQTLMAWSYFILSKKILSIPNATTKKICFEEKKNQNIFMLSHLFCRSQCSYIRVIQTSWDLRHLFLGQ